MNVVDWVGITLAGIGTIGNVSFMKLLHFSMKQLNLVLLGTAFIHWSRYSISTTTFLKLLVLDVLTGR